MGLWVPGTVGGERLVEIQIPHRLVQSLFDFLGSLSNQEVGTALSRWRGMTNEVATKLNMDLTAIYKHLWDGGFKHRWKPNDEPHSWKISRERGWAETKTTRSSLTETK